MITARQSGKLHPFPPPRPPLYFHWTISLSMGDEIPANPSPSPIYLLPPALPPAPSPTSDPLEAARNGRFMSRRRPPLRFTTEFDSEGPLFLHKVSCKLFDSLAKLKFSFQNNTKGEIFCPQLGFITRNLSVLYDVESCNAFLRGSLNLGKNLQLQTTYDIQDQLGAVATIANLPNPSAVKLELSSSVPSNGLCFNIINWHIRKE